MENIPPDALHIKNRLLLPTAAKKRNVHTIKNDDLHYCSPSNHTNSRQISEKETPAEYIQSVMKKNRSVGTTTSFLAGGGRGGGGQPGWSRPWNERQIRLNKIKKTTH
jgi:hypothetical protein